jgi:dipeptidyl aminopeptidase/acylaminoacyl peptidase
MTSGSPPRPIEPRDLFRLRAVSEVTIHPSNGSAVFAISWPDESTDSNRSQLHLLNGDETTQISYGHRDQMARFSPTGSRLAFTRLEPERAGAATKVMVLDWATRALHQVASVDDGVTALHWIDEDHLALIVRTRPPDQVGVDDEELARRPRIITRADYRFNGRGFTYDRLGQVATLTLPSPLASTPAASDLEYLSDQSADPGYPMVDTEHQTLAVSPDRSRIAVIAGPDPEDDLTLSNHIWVHHLDGSAPAQRLTDPGGAWQALCWHHEGPIVAVGALDTSVPTFGRPHTFDPTGTGSDHRGPVVLGPHDVNASPGIGAAACLVAVDGGILASGIRGGALSIDHYAFDSGAITPRGHGQYQATTFDATPDGARIVAAVTTPQRPAELWDLSGPDPTVLVGLNHDLLAELDLATTETVSVDHDDGHSIEAFLVRPPASAPGPATDGRRPGLVYVHGGPMSHYGYSFFDEFQMAAAEGFVVIGANPRGSDGYGLDWATSIVGDLGGPDWEDIVAVTDHLAAQPEVDEARIGIGGGSYGGFMASWAIGHTDRYAAALVERAVTSWPSMLGTSDIGARFVPALLGATAESDLDALTRQSPLTHVTAARTPTLIVHSEHDWRCPIEQAEQLFVALRRNGCEVTMVRFPGENHELSRRGSPRHRVERFELIGQFFARHLLGAGASHDHPDGLSGAEGDRSG